MTYSNNIFWNWTTRSNPRPRTSVLAQIIFLRRDQRARATTTNLHGALIKDPLFASTVLEIPTPSSCCGFTGIDAGSTTYGSGAQACATRTLNDLFGTAVP